jgi:hypothetical protein
MPEWWNDKEVSMMPKTPCPRDVMTDEKKEGIELVTPNKKTSYNGVNNTPIEIRCAFNMSNTNIDDTIDI